jgi:hypothetical protein
MFGTEIQEINRSDEITLDIIEGIHVRAGRSGRAQQMNDNIRLGYARFELQQVMPIGPGTPDLFRWGPIGAWVATEKMNFVLGIG